MRAEPLPVLGAGRPVAYVPGIDGTGRMLFGSEERIAARFRLHRLRYVGTAAEGAALYARLADTALDALPREPLVVLAESFGGAVALTMALRAPERVAALCLVNTFARYPARIRIRLGARLAPHAPVGLLRLGRRFLARRTFFSGRADEAAMAAFRAMEPGFVGGGHPARLAAIRDLDLLPDLPRIGAPSDLYASTRDRIVPSVRTMSRIAEGLQGARLMRLEGAGHIVLPLRAEPWADRLEALWDRAAADPAGPAASGPTENP